MNKDKILWASLLLGGPTVQAQGLEGVFEPDGKRTKTVSFTAEWFRFSGSQFEYHYSSCTEGWRGRGSYILRGDTLRLRFEPLSPPGSVLAMPCAPSSLTPRFCVLVTNAATHQPMEGIWIASRNGKVSTQTNTEGEAVLAHTVEPNDSLRIGYPAYGITVPITAPTGQGYRVTLAEHDIIRPGTIYTYLVKQEGKDQLVIRRPESSEKPEYYRRRSARKLQKFPYVW